MPPSEQLSKFYDKLGIEPPQSVSHGVTADDIREKLLPANPKNWRLVGNVLHCDTDFGPLAQTISPDYVLRGTDENGLPILTAIAL